MRARTYLLSMAALLLVPLCLISAVAIAKLIDAEREARLQGALQAAKAGVLLIERDLAVAEASLRALTLSPALRNGDLATLHQHASAINAGKSSAWTLLSNLDGRPLMNTLLPFGTALPDISGPWARSVYSGQRGLVSGYFRGTLAKRPTISVDIPVPAGHGAPAVLSQVFDATHFTRLIAASRVPDSWVVAIFDAGGTIIARSRDNAQFAGKTAHPRMLEASNRAQDGVVRLTTRNGLDVYVLYARSIRANWTVAIGVPVGEIDAAAQAAVRYAVLVVLVLAALAIVGATLFAKRLAAALDSAGATSDALAKGRDCPPHVRTGVTEVDQILARMLSTSRHLARALSARQELESERERLLEVEQDARRQAEAESKAKDEFIAMLGHELRNPLAAIAAAQQLLSFPNIAQQQRDHALGVCDRQMRHLTKIIDALLDLHRIASGKLEVDLAPLALDTVVRNCCEVKRLVDADRHLWSCQIQPVTIHGNRERLTQVIDNLLHNAAKYTPPGGSITVRCYQTDSAAVVEVEDTGAGMEPELIARVFQPLVQGSTTIDRAMGGLGLGLAVVRQLTELHGGTATAHSRGSGHGSLFRLSFPLVGNDTALQRPGAVAVNSEGTT